MVGGFSLNFDIDYKLLNEKMAEFLDKHSDEVMAILGQCFRIVPPDPGKRMQEINGPIIAPENIPDTDHAFDNMFGNKK